MTRFLIALTILAAPLAAQESLPPVGSIEIYGLEHVVDSVVRRAVDLVPGDPPPGRAAQAAMLTRLRAIRGVRDASFNGVCCDARGKTMVFVGIAESGTPRLTYRPSPAGSIRLPAGIVARDSVFGVRLIEAVRAGRSAEADSGGHEFFVDSALNAIQHEYLAFAPTRLALIRDVLEHSASTQQRVLAAELLNYAPRVRDVIPDLVAALRDPASDVRNAAMRSLWAIASYGQAKPELGIHVPFAPFIDLLGSLDWTDRNKSSLALMQLTVGRDSSLLTELRARAIRPLLEIARWSDPGHAFPAVVILGRIEGRRDQEIFGALQRGDRTAIVAQAERLLQESP
ncbi:MAG TPA: hypothetical protein VGI97_00990 [Gemmatimonadaceae bacterium]